jgi:hypothetical protein
MKLYVANCSKQEHDFTYMLIENPRPFHHKIRAGTQMEINGSLEEIDHIIKQHSIYGMMEVNKVQKGFGGICYRLNKPISVDAIEAGLDQRDQEMIDRALEARKITAAAADQILSNKAQEMGLKQKAGLEVEVVEEKKNAADNEPKFNQTIEVLREGAEPGKSRGRPRKS